MSNARTVVFLLVAIFAAACAEVAFTYYAQQEPKASVNSTLVSGMEDVSRIVIEREAGGAVVLEKREDWKFVAPFSGDADEREIARLTDALTLTPIADVLSDSDLLKFGRSRSDFSLVTPLIRVIVSSGDRSVTVSFGAPTPAADGVYASVEGVSAVFVTPSDVFAAVDRPADSFRRRSLFGRDAADVSAFGIKRGEGSVLTFVREGDGWKVAGAKASEQKVRGFLSALASAVAGDFLWPVGASNETERASSALLAGYGLDPENAVTVTLKGLDGVDQQVSFGKNVDERQVYALVQNGGAVVTLPVALRDAAVQDQVMFADSRIFPVEARAVATLSIVDGDTACALAREEGGTWRLEAPVVAAADNVVVEEVLMRILSLSPFDADSSGVAVAISTNAPAVRVSRERVFGKYGFKSLRSREIVRLVPELVRRIVRTSGEAGAKPVSVAYGRDLRVWNVETAENGATADERGVASVLAALNPLVAVRVVKLKVSAAELDDYGLGRPFLTIAVDQDREDAVRRNVLIGAKTVGGRFATVGSSDAVFVISDETVSRLSVPIVEAPRRD